MGDHASATPEPAPKIVPPEPRGVLTEPWSPRKLGRLLALFGPAAIVASVAIGAGETIIVVRGGSWFAYDLLWLVLLSSIVKGVFVTYLLGRYTAVSGEPLGQRLARVPGPRGWLLLALILLEMAAAGPLWAAVARPCGDLLFHIFSGGAHPPHELLIERVITTVFITAALLVGLFLNYSSLEKQQVVICGVLIVGTIIGTLLVRPDVWAILRGSLSFGHVPEFPPWAPESVRQHAALTLATTFGYVGGSVLTYVVYADWISLHGWGLTGHRNIDTIRRRAAAGMPGDYLPDDPPSVQRILRSIAPLKWDVGIGAFVLWSVSGSFMVAGAVVLYPLLQSGDLSAAFTEWNLLTDQASIWRNVHESLIWVYYISVLAALWGTLQAYPEIYSRVILDFGQSVFPRGKWTRRKVQTWVTIYVFAASMLVVWSNLAFDTLTHIVAFLATNLGVALAMLAALYLNFQLPPAYRTRWWMLAGGVASAAILVIVSAISGVGLWEELSRTR